jgi:hypothetical protein
MGPRFSFLSRKKGAEGRRRNHHYSLTSSLTAGVGFAHRRCSAVELGYAGGAWLLYGLLFLVTSVMQK